MAKKEPSLEEVLAKLAKDHGTMIGGLGEVAKDVKGMSMGNISLDALTGIGGMPEGRVAEFFGQPSSGKTTAAIQTLVEAQKASSRRTAFLDMEQALDPKYVAALGADISPDRLTVSQPDFLEQAAEIGLGLAATGAYSLIVFDSVAAMTPRKKNQIAVGDPIQLGMAAKMMAHFLEKAINVCAETGTAMIFLNHISEVINTGFTPPGMPKQWTTPGGKALKFYASLRLEFKQVGKVKEKAFNALTGETEELATGTLTQVSVIKNKVGPPYGQAKVLVRHGKGFANSYSVIAILAGNRVIQKDGSGIFRLPSDLVASMTDQTQLSSKQLDAEGGGFIKGEPRFMDVLESDPGLMAACAARATMLARESKLVVPRDELEAMLAVPGELAEQDALDKMSPQDVTKLLLGR